MTEAEPFRDGTKTTRNCLKCIEPTPHVRSGGVWKCESCGRRERIRT